MTASIRLRIVLIPILAAFAVGCGGPSTPPPEESGAAPVKWSAPQVLALEDWQELFGVTQPLPGRLARVEARIDGRVASLLAGADGKPLHEGQVVEEKQVIGRLDDHIAQLNREKTKQSLNALEQEKAQAKIAADLSGEKLAKLQALEKKTPGFVPEIDMLSAKAADADAKSKALGAANRLEAAVKELAVLDEQIKLYDLVAPRKGRLGRVQAAVGQSLALAAAVADVVDVDEEIDVLCFASARAVAGLHPGLEARLGGLDGASDADVRGEVAFVAEQAEPDTGCYAVKIRFPNKKPSLRSGEAKRVHVLLKTVNDQWSVPESALMEDERLPAVFVVENYKKETKDGKEEETGTVRRLRVKVGVRSRQVNQVGILRPKDCDAKDAEWWSKNVDDVLVVTGRGHGLQTGDKVKLQQDED
jgi:RND family efflux transporter MFP subunit